MSLISYMSNLCHLLNGGANIFLTVMQGCMRSHMWMSFKITALRNLMNRKTSVPLCNFTNLGQLPKTTFQKKGWLLRCIWWLPIFTHTIPGMIPALQTSTRHRKQSDRLLHLTAPSLQEVCGLECSKCQGPQLCLILKELFPLLGPVPGALSWCLQDSASFNLRLNFFFNVTYQRQDLFYIWH